MKKNKFWLLSIITTIIMPSVLAATTRTSQQGLFGDLIQRMRDTLQEFLTYTLTIPHPYSVAGTSMQEVVPLWSVFAVFTLLFAIIYAASAKIKIFDEEHKGPRKAFCIALALIVMFGTPVTELFVIVFAGYFTSLLSLLIVVGFILGLWLILFLIPGRAIASGARWKDQNTIMSGEKKAESIEAMKASHDAGLMKKDLRREKRGFKKLGRLLDKETKAIGDLKKHLIHVREEINIVERLRDTPSRLAEAKQKILNELSDLIPIVDKERRIDNKIISVTSRVERLELRDVRLVRREGAELVIEDKWVNKVKGSLKKEHGENLKEKQLVQHLNSILLTVKGYTEKIRQIEVEFNRFNEVVNHSVEEASQAVRANNFPQAIIHINEAIVALDKQERLIVEIESVEKSLIAIERQEYGIEQFIQRDEGREAKEAEIEVIPMEFQGSGR